MTVLASEHQGGVVVLFGRVHVGARLDQDASTQIVTVLGSDHDGGPALLIRVIDVGLRLDQDASAQIVTKAARAVQRRAAIIELLVGCAEAVAREDREAHQCSAMLP